MAMISPVFRELVGYNWEPVAVHPGARNLRVVREPFGNMIFDDPRIAAWTPMPTKVVLELQSLFPVWLTQDDPPCHTEACAIQTCLTRNAYKEEWCKWALGDLYQCCQEFYYNNEEGKTPSCPQYKKLQKILSMKVKEKEKRYWNGTESGNCPVELRGFLIWDFQRMPKHGRMRAGGCTIHIWTMQW